MGVAEQAGVGAHRDARVPGLPGADSRHQGAAGAKGPPRRPSPTISPHATPCVTATAAEQTCRLCLLQLEKASRASSMQYVKVLGTVALGVVFLHEELTVSPRPAKRPPSSRL